MAIKACLKASSEPLLSSFQQSMSYSTETKIDCLRSLCYNEIHARHHDIETAHHNTCDWILSTQEFQDWLNQDDDCNGVLWIKGNPGAGKSTLMKHMLKHCKGACPESIILAYFFHARGEVLEKTLWACFVL
jgi:hypothetical protein